MPWNEPGGNQQDPWSGKKRGSGGNDPEELIRKLNEKLGKLFGGSGGNGDNSSQNSSKGIIFLLILFVVGWLLSGFYTVDARQQGLVLRFGAYQATTDAGLHWRLPYPIETVEIVDTEQNRSAQDRNTMLTKDENIVEVAVAAQYKVRNPEDYAFNILNPDFLADQTQGTLYQVMRGVAREVIGRNDMDFILKEGRAQIASDIQNQMQQVLDNYKSGLQIITVNLTYAEAPPQVKEAFDEANKAREDANRYQNEAQTYANKVIPEARGKAARLKAESEAFRQETVSRAEGDASRFMQLVTEYRKAPEVTRERLYLETMETVMAGSRKIVIDSNSNNMLYLPLDQLNGQTSTAAGNTAQAAAAAMQNATDKSNATPTPTDVPATNAEVTRTGREAGVRESR
ncbi:FtsH protease activity modulator HflK [Thiothrix subterranea]|uniref:Protein HflK n=1 Tax=Thiothrix subterranea TaxID=2735563 RepID=A0AA51QYB7_9GAMM|nr:FtsH protease activity modulator HflK [Thiothrix subterranea]MDQ5770265.1 FtsH protease activity modulator HflK [Thiothrix subterranea]QQZ30630.1 FtsH protease activity modulator HflK [Thiothrix subterranea]WML85807.1 FtsH protease activity modulator HflK [Thiothrix subterranea]